MAIPPKKDLNRAERERAWLDAIDDLKFSVTKALENGHRMQSASLTTNLFGEVTSNVMMAIGRKE